MTEENGERDSRSADAGSSSTPTDDGSTRIDAAAADSREEARPRIDRDPPVSQILYGRDRRLSLRMGVLGVVLLAIAAGAVVVDDPEGVVALAAVGTNPVYAGCVAVGVVASAAHAYLNDGALGSIPLPIAPGVGVALVVVANEVFSGGDPGLAVVWYAYQLLVLLALGAVSFAIGLFGSRIVAAIRYG
jgi:hypothetical protein